jgi:3-oxocholest-4-en-26-oate---CoA ligase
MSAPATAPADVVDPVTTADLAPEWTVTAIWDAIAGAVPDRPAIVQGRRVLSWGAFERRARALSHGLSAVGSPAQAKVIVLLRNAPEYLESYYAAFKAGLVPVNANWRYGVAELTYLIDNADAEIVIFGAEFLNVVRAIREELPRVRRWIIVGGDSDTRPDWVHSYDTMASAAVAPIDLNLSEPADALILYTGGTTGVPKGVVWRQDELIHILGAGEDPLGELDPMATPDVAAARALAVEGGTIKGRGLMITPAPLMHATALFTSISVLLAGGTVALLPSRRFDAAELFDEAERLSAEVITIAGQAFAVPMLEALDAAAGRWRLPKLRRIGSSGTMWSTDNKEGLLRHLPHIELADALGSSEAIGVAVARSVAGEIAPSARFEIGDHVAVFDDSGARIQPGSGDEGWLALFGHIPSGYYKDPERTAGTFRIIEGKRWSLPGDLAVVEADGAIRLLGRGSGVINTGGEKVFPEEIEDVIRQHPLVRDVLVLGMPDARLTERVCAIVERWPRRAAPDRAVIAAHVRSQLADYKAPRTVVVAAVPRLENGKPDFAQARRLIDGGG